MCAVRCGKIQVIRLLIHGKPNLNIQEKASYIATKSSKHLINYLNALQEAGRTALMFAAEDGNMEAVKLLISAGADVNIRDKVRRLELLIGAVSCHVYSYPCRMG